MSLGVSRKDLVMVAVMLSGALLAVLNLTLLSPALPTIMADLGIERTTAQWLTSGYSLVEACVIPLSAYLMGRFPMRKLFIAGMCIFGAGSLLAAFAPAFPFLLAGRMLQATCTGMVMPMVSTVILLVFPREKRGTAMGMIGLIIGFAPAIGPSLSGLLVDHLGWRALFGVVAALTVVVIALAFAFLKNFGEFRRTSFDVLSVALSTCGLLCLLYGLSTVSSASNLALSAVLIVVGAVVVALYARRQTRLDEPMLHIDILKTRRYATAVVTIMLLQAALMGLEVLMPLYIQDVRGYSATVSGVAMLPGALIGAVAGVFAGRLFDRYGVRKVAIPGACVMIAGAFVLTCLGMESHIVMVTAAYTTMALGLQFITTPLNTWGVNSLDNAMVQHAQPLSNTLNQVAGSFGTALLVSISSIATQMTADQGELASSFNGDHAAFTATFCLLAVAVVVIVALARDKASDRAAAPAAPAETAAVADQAAGGAAAAAAAAGVPADAVRAAAQLDAPGVPLVSAVMNAEPYYVSADATMNEVVQMLDRFQTSGVPVVDGERRVVGFISDGDIADYLGRHEASIFDPKLNLLNFYDSGEFRYRLDDLLALDVMRVATKHVVSVEAGMPLDRAIRAMSDRHIKKMPVVDGAGRLVGTLSRRDIIHSIVLSDPNLPGPSASPLAAGAAE